MNKQEKKEDRLDISNCVYKIRIIKIKLSDMFTTKKLTPLRECVHTHTADDRSVKD